MGEPPDREAVALLAVVLELAGAAGAVE